MRIQPPPPPGECVISPYGVNQKGYAYRNLGPHSTRKRKYHHRLAWEEANGPIPEGMVIDHLCYVRNCINLDHLELVTPAENSRRQQKAGKTHCIRGHELTQDNLVAGEPWRKCKKCHAFRQARRKARLREEAATAA